MTLPQTILPEVHRSVRVSVRPWCRHQMGGFGWTALVVHPLSAALLSAVLVVSVAVLAVGVVAL